MDEMMAVIKMFAGNFAPRSFAFCQGQTIAIAQNTALFSLLGTTFGGNGQTTFMLPDFRGRVPVGTGQGPGLSSYVLGQQAGVETVTLLSTQMPLHNHVATAAAPTLPVSNNNASSHVAAADGTLVLAAPVDGAGLDVYGFVGDASPAAKLNATSGAITVGTAGGSQPHTNIQPYLAMNFIICMEGIYPSRN